jgi:hypothetical protein
MNFFLTYTSNITQNKFFIRELSFKQFKTLNKFLHNKNDETINSCFEQILQENILNKENYTTLTNFDKFCLLFLLRISSISSELEFKKDVFNTKINLLQQFNAISSFNKFTKTTIQENFLKINLNLPKTLFFKDIFTVFLECIEDITITNNGKEQNIIFSTLTAQQKLDFYNNLPISLISHIQDYKKTNETAANHLTISFDNTNHPELNPFSLTLFDILKILFFTDLKSLYDMQYHIVNKVNFTPEYVENNTFLENLLILNHYSDELVRKEQEMKKQVDNSNPLTK